MESTFSLADIADRAVYVVVGRRADLFAPDSAPPNPGSEPLPHEPPIWQVALGISASAEPVAPARSTDVNSAEHHIGCGTLACYFSNQYSPSAEV
jgi:hypothetical protein